MKVVKLWVNKNRLYIKLKNGEEKSVALQRFPRLKKATDEQRNKWEQFDDELRWEDLDEDIYLKSFDIADNSKNVIRF